MATSVSEFLPENDRAGQPIIRPRLHHWAIATTKNKEMFEWYRDVLGYEAVARPAFPLPEMTFVSNDMNHHGGSFLSPPQLKDPENRLDLTRIQHIAWEYDSIDEMLESWQRIGNLGIHPVSCWCHGPSFSIYYKDPDNNTVELNVQAFNTLEEALAFALSPEWEASPNGIQFDPIKLIDARKNGVELNELRERALAKEYWPNEPASELSAW